MIAASYELPKVKNLFYLTSLSKDSEFINIDTLPSLFQKKVIASNFNDYLLTQEYFAFDVIALNNDEYNQYRNILKKFLKKDDVSEEIAYREKKETEEKQQLEQQNKNNFTKAN